MIMQLSGEAIVDDWGGVDGGGGAQAGAPPGPLRPSSGVETFYWGKRIGSSEHDVRPDTPAAPGRCPVTGAQAGDNGHDVRWSRTLEGLQTANADKHASPQRSSGASKYGTQSSRRSSWRDTNRKLLVLKLGVLELEDGHLLSHYRIQDNSVIHADWDSLQRGPPYASRVLSWLDPDYWVENHKQAQEFWKNLSYEQVIQQNWWGKFVWPGPLVMTRTRSVMA
jgi:hypothetical protein